MPYFKHKDIHLLLIHIPKTGGTSIERYIFSKYQYSLINHKKLIGFLPESEMKRTGIYSSLQHLTYQNMYDNSHYFEIDFSDNIQVITVVRNPYDRIISQLFYKKYLQYDDTPETANKVITSIMEKYIASPELEDFHYRPQYSYIVDKNNELIDTITILKTETLEEDMKKIGFTDFTMKINESKHKPSRDYLNKSSIDIINQIYEKDFLLLGYERLEN